MNLIELRHLLHQNAERSFCEYKTKEILMNELKNHKGHLIEIEGTNSLLVEYNFKKSRTVMIRCEMDGLMIQEKTSKEYASLNGCVMHACGHDGHMAILCGVSRLLSGYTDCPVNVLLVFQSAEETGSGSRLILQDKEFLKRCPDEAIALHVMPKLEHGKLYTKMGVMAAGSREIDVCYTGESVHCAHHDEIDDVLKKGIYFMNELYLQKFEDGFISMNVMRAGDIRNQTAGQCKISGTMRFINEKSENKMIDWLKQSVCQESLCLSSQYPVLICSAKMAERAFQSGACSLREPLWICDDFACFAQCIPSVYVLLGMESSVDLHHPEFDFSDDLIEVGVQFLMKMILKK
ncbi:MAG: M20/M25/M40 family metallo-hydrolase [Erysipelotrichaceae bacterium]|nr:M20/M25/M40 family metallo-hydrolase [Erysipelotrichaceae bacterium]